MIQIFDCDQNSADWMEARRGIPTASEFHTILAKGKGGAESVTRRKYLHRLAGEIITGEVEETYTNAHMDRGHDMEADARNHYALITDAEPRLVGFVRNGDRGCSPDSLLGDNGVLELKTKLPSVLIDCLVRDDFPPEHRAQCQGALLVTEREWVDIACYWPRMPLFTKRAYRDEAYIRELSDAIDRFNEELALIVERIRSYGTGPDLGDRLRRSLELT
jgi:hypothetical protein